MPNIESIATDRQAVLRVKLDRFLRETIVAEKGSEIETAVLYKRYLDAVDAGNFATQRLVSRAASTMYGSVVVCHHNKYWLQGVRFVDTPYIPVQRARKNRNQHDPYVVAEIGRFIKLALRKGGMEPTYGQVYIRFKELNPDSTISQYVVSGCINQILGIRPARRGGALYLQGYSLRTPQVIE